MKREAPYTNALDVISSLSARQISLFAVVAFLSVYLPISASLVLSGSYPKIVDLFAVFFFGLLALGAAVIVAAVRFESTQLSAVQKRREKVAWWIIVVFAASVLFARLLYALEELRDDAGAARLHVVPIADFIFVAATVLFAVGLILIPWTDQPLRGTSILVDVALVIVSIFTVFWPFLFGPLLSGKLADVLSMRESDDYMLGVLVLLVLIFWIIIQDVRDELWPTAAAFVLAVSVMVIIQLSHLAMILASFDGMNSPTHLLIINAATSLTFVLISLAAVLRLRSVSQPAPEAEQDLVSGQSPIRTWQIVLPYPIVAVLMGIRLSMELLTWGEEYRIGMIIGITIVGGLLIIRLLQMLRYNQYLYRKVAESAIRDGLTGLYNHRAVHDALKSEIERAQRSGDSIAIYFIDIDHFKQLNDTWGHRQGDRVLIMVADTLSQVSREGDVVGRYGGEEFVVIAPGVDRQEAMSLGERFRLSAAGLDFVFGGERVTLTVSVGIALYPEDGGDAECLIERADQAMYDAKAAGRNVTKQYDPTG